MMARRRVRGLRVVKRLPASGPGFLRLERCLVRNLYAGGERSAPYRFEVLHRRGVDAVAIIPFFFERGRLMIVIKIGFRPGLLLRSRLRLPLRDRRRYTFMREAVAGGLEPGDRGPRGIDDRARNESPSDGGQDDPAGSRVLSIPRAVDGEGPHEGRAGRSAARGRPAVRRLDQRGRLRDGGARGTPGPRHVLGRHDRRPEDRDRGDAVVPHPGPADPASPRRGLSASGQGRPATLVAIWATQPGHPSHRGGSGRCQSNAGLQGLCARIPLSARQAANWADRLLTPL